MVVMAVLVVLVAVVVIVAAVLVVLDRGLAARPCTAPRAFSPSTTAAPKRVAVIGGGWFASPFLSFPFHRGDINVRVMWRTPVNIELELSMFRDCGRKRCLGVAEKWIRCDHF